MNATALSVKDFVIDISETQQKIKQKKIQQKSQVLTTYDVVLQNNIDFVLHRKTATTDKNLVFLISQGTFYIQDNKSKDVETLSEQKLRAFFLPIYHDKFEKLDKVVWWNNGKPIYAIDKMIEIIKDRTVQKMYQHGIVADKYQIGIWKESFENNIKLFKYSHDKCQNSNVNRDCFSYILSLATTIEQKINYNNAVQFIDKFCDSNMKMFLEDGHRYNSSKPKGDKENNEVFMNLINTYSLDFNRFIEFISYDLYSQGIGQFDKNILKEYSDYLRMQISLYGKVKEKYPKHFRTEHDIIALKISIYEKHKQDLMLLNVIDNYKYLEYKNDEYCIVLPESSMDIVDEGISLSSCVASYVDNVVKNKSLIVFLRRVDEVDKSLVTVEVQNKSIVQAKGYANRKINNEEEKFLNKWAKVKELHYNI